MHIVSTPGLDAGCARVKAHNYVIGLYARLVTRFGKTRHNVVIAKKFFY